MTNREAMSLGLTPCECNPISGNVSLASDEFHAQAVITVQMPETVTEISANQNGNPHENLVHACFDCATKHFKNCYGWQSGVVWTK